MRIFHFCCIVHIENLDFNPSYEKGTIMKSLGKVIANHRKERNMSQPELAAALTQSGYPIKVGAISSWETGNSQPGAGLFLEVCRILEITDIYEQFIGANPNNLFESLNEEGKEKALDYIRLLVLSGEYKRTAEIIPFTRTLPLFDLPASAGKGSFLDGDSYEMIEVGSEVPEIADFGIKISGDSMLPRFLDKQIVWVQKTDYLENGEFGIFYLDGNSYIKKFQDLPGNMALLSLNPIYAPLPVRENSTFKIFGRVVG